MRGGLTRESYWVGQLDRLRVPWGLCLASDCISLGSTTPTGSQTVGSISEGVITPLVLWVSPPHPLCLLDPGSPPSPALEEPAFSLQELEVLPPRKVLIGALCVTQHFFMSYLGEQTPVSQLDMPLIKEVTTCNSCMKAGWGGSLPDPPQLVPIWIEGCLLCGALGSLEPIYQSQPPIPGASLGWAEPPPIPFTAYGVKSGANCLPLCSDYLI